MTKEKIKPEDKAFLCRHINNGYCKVIEHEILNGFASRCHCKNCKMFKFKGQNDKRK